jgi:hypothetical protein
MTGRVKEGRKGLPLPATGDEKGAFIPILATPVPTFGPRGQPIVFKRIILQF